MTVLIAGGGIAGLTLGLTLHQIGVPFRIFEQTTAIRPMGVGINLQPNAVRELFELGLADALDRIGVRTQEYGFYSKHGLEIWTEPRGTWAGYRWPQYSVHRGKLQVLLYETLLSRAGPECLSLGSRAIGFENTPSGVTLHVQSSGHEPRTSVQGDLIVGADGIHSALRAQMNPDEGPPVWGGAVLWRATTEARPFRGGASMALIGHAKQRIVAYPISKPDPDTGKSTINWIAERTVDPSSGWNKEDWNRLAKKSDFLPDFENWHFDWLDIPNLIRGADEVFEYPMVDRDPIGNWTDGRVTLMGDAAHPTYPVGSNGASQAIVDARIIGAALLQNDISQDALLAYQERVLPQTTKVTLTNRGQGPDAILQMVEDRSSGLFKQIEDVVPHQELADHAAKYKALAGFSIEALNNAPPILPSGARIQT